MAIVTPSAMPIQPIDGATPTGAADVMKTPLPADQAGKWRLRSICCGVLGLMTLAAAFLSVFFFYVWVLTAIACYRTYVLRIPRPGDQPRTLLEWFIDLDLSTSMVAILFILCVSITWRGLSSLKLYWRDRTVPASFFGHAYAHSLFRPGFKRLCIEVGLLGALFSFALASISLLADLERRQANARREAEARKVVGGPPAALLDDVDRDAPEIGSFSERILLVVFAALTGALTGTAVSVIFVPLLDGVNRVFLGNPFFPAAPVSFEAKFSETQRAALSEMITFTVGVRDLTTFIKSLSSDQSLLASIQKLTAALIAHQEHSRMDAASFAEGAKAFKESAEAQAALCVKLTEMIPRLAGAVEALSSANAALQTETKATAAKRAELTGLAKKVDALLTATNAGLAAFFGALASIKDYLISTKTSQDHQQQVLDDLKAAGGKIAAEFPEWAKVVPTQVVEPLARNTDAITALAENQEKLAAQIAAVAKAVEAIQVKLDTQDLQPSLDDRLAQIRAALGQAPSELSQTNGRHWWLASLLFWKRRS
jgi:hypothetical protein